MNVKNKLIIGLISSCMMITCAGVIIHAETNDNVVGLSNSIKKLQIRNIKTDNELNDMTIARNSAFNDYWPYWLETTKEMG